MLQITRAARSVAAGVLAVMVAVTACPVSAFAGTDYEAAYNRAKASYEQKQAETASAYSAWQAALTKSDRLKTEYDKAKAAAVAAQNSIDSAHLEVDRRHRILDYAARNAMNDLSVQAYTAECSKNAGPDKIKEMADTNTRIANLSQSKTSNKDYSKLMMPAKSVSSCHYGVTLSSAGTDDTDSVNWYQYCVYMGESYDRLMLTLEYFDENNRFRKKYESFMRSDEMRENGMGYSEIRPLARVDVLVSPYLMVQAATNAPWNRGGHHALAYHGYPGSSAAQNLASTWGDVDAFANGKYTFPSKDPFHGLFYAEEIEFKKNGWDSNGIGHYLNILGNNTHGGMACTYGGTSVFEQDFIYSNKATGYTVSQYRSMINDRVSSELSAYNNAANAYEQAITDAETAKDNADAAFDTYWDAKYDADGAETTYKNAVTAEQSAKAAMDQAYQDWHNSQNQDSGQPGENTGGSTEPTQPAQPTQPTQPVHNDEVGKVKGVTIAETSVYETLKKSSLTITWNAYQGAEKYAVYKSTDGKNFSLVTRVSGKTLKLTTAADWNTTYYYKVHAEEAYEYLIGISDIVSIKTHTEQAGQTEPAPTTEPTKPSTATVSGANGGSTQPIAPSLIRLGTPSVGKIKINAKKKTAAIWFKGADNAKTYKVEIRRAYKLKGKKKIAVSGKWKAYNVSSPTKKAWVYKKKVTEKQSKKYQGNANYKLTKSGKKYKLYHKEKAAPVTAKKLTRNSIYQVRVTAYNGNSSKTSAVKTFAIK